MKTPILLASLALAACQTTAQTAELAVSTAILTEIGVRARCPRNPTEVAAFMVGRTAFESTLAVQGIVLTDDQRLRLAVARSDTDRVCLLGA